MPLSKPCRVAVCMLTLASASILRSRHPVTDEPHEPLITSKSPRTLNGFGKAIHPFADIWQTREEKAGITPLPKGADVVDVLAFGDSLTEGFGRRPYPDQLQEMLNSLHSYGGFKKRVYRVANAGIPGELTDSMVLRLPDTIAHLKAAGRKPAFVLILGGTNDLLWGNMTSDTVLANLRSMRAAALQEHTKPMLFTLPRLDVEENSHNITQAKIVPNEPAMRAVNVALKKEAQSDASMLLADISEISRKHLVDGVHFNGKGYARLAEVAYNVMKPMLS